MKAQIEAALSWMADIDPQLVEQAREKFGLTAAAEVGEIAPCDDAEFGTYDHVINDRDATIERCAQRIDDEADKEMDAAQKALLHRAAAAIRAMKPGP